MTHMTLKKPAKGSAAKARRAARAAIERRERAAKLAAKERDEFRCRCCGVVGSDMDDWRWMEAAHLVTKGHGGDHGLFSCEPKHFVCLCNRCHTGPRSVHSGHVRMVYGPDMGDGVVEFVAQKVVDTHRRNL